MLFHVRSRGITLIELVVAVSVLAVGALAAAASAVPLARLVVRGGAQARAAGSAGAAIEALRAAGCGAVADGSASLGGVGLTWRLAQVGRLRMVTITTTYAWGPGMHRDVYEASVACAR